MIRLQPIDILLVEDNLGDIELTEQAFLSARIPNHIHAVHDGEEALEYLYRRGAYADVPRPDMILLDLNMPRKNGKDVLAVIKVDNTLQDIPVIILTSSQAAEDIAMSYQLHANAYIVKPTHLHQFLKVVETVETFWLDVAKLPSRARKKA